MSDKKLNKKRLNRKSYVINLALTLPSFIVSMALGRSAADSPYDDVQGFGIMAQLLAMILAVVIITWTIKRLHDVARSGWYSFLLIPPFTIFLLAYLLLSSSNDNQEKWGNPDNQVRIFGIQARGAIRMAAISLIGLLVGYLGLLSYNFYMSVS